MKKTLFPLAFPDHINFVNIGKGEGGLKVFQKRRGNPRMGNYLKSGREIPSANYGLLKFNLPSNSILKKTPQTILFLLTFIMVVLFILPTIIAWNASWLSHFRSMLYFYTPWNHQKTFGFLMFSRGIEREQWDEMGWPKLYYIYFWEISLN